MLSSLCYALWNARNCSGAKATTLGCIFVNAQIKMSNIDIEQLILACFVDASL